MMCARAATPLVKATAFNLALCVVVVSLASAGMSLATELTFDMEPHVESCFYEEAKKSEEVTLDFQVSILCSRKIDDTCAINQQCQCADEVVSQLQAGVLL